MKTRNLKLKLAGLAMVLGTAAGALASDTATPATSVPGNNPPPAVQKAQPKLSPWASQVQKLALAGVDEDVIFSYIDSAGTFNLTPDQIISLTKGGVPRTVIAAMLQHDADIFAGVKQVTASTVPNSDGESPLIPPPSKAPAPMTVAAAPKEPLASAWDNYPPDFWLTPLDETYTPPEMQERSPVRKPYPVPLTAPILVWRIP